MIHELIVTTESTVDFYDVSSFQLTSQHIRDQAFIGSLEMFRQWHNALNLQMIENGFRVEWIRDEEPYTITYLKVDKPDEEVDITNLR